MKNIIVGLMVLLLAPNVFAHVTTQEKTNKHKAVKSQPVDQEVIREAVRKIVREELQNIVREEVQKAEAANTVVKAKAKSEAKSRVNNDYEREQAEAEKSAETGLMGERSEQ